MENHITDSQIRCGSEGEKIIYSNDMSNRGRIGGLLCQKLN